VNEAVTPPKPKKSVALSGVVAGNTALCSVGRSGNDLHYRGYDILEIANTWSSKEIAYLLCAREAAQRGGTGSLQARSSRACAAAGGP